MGEVRAEAQVIMHFLFVCPKMSAAYSALQSLHYWLTALLRVALQLSYHGSIFCTVQGV